MLRPSSWALRLGLEVLDWLLPPRCVGCGMAGEYLCPLCQGHIRLLQPPYCEVCGQPWREEWGPAGTLCPACAVHRPAYEQARAYAWMEGVAREAIHALKYRRGLALGALMADWLAWVVKREGWDVEVVVPVPLGPKRQSERGYNQAEWLAWPLAQRLRVAYARDAVVRFRETMTQVGLDAQARRQNVTGAFRLQKPLPYRRVLLVDDVMTTGATLDAVAQALQQQGKVESVWAVVVARAVLRHAKPSGTGTDLAV